jgi:hypothetical protein
MRPFATATVFRAGEAAPLDDESVGFVRTTAFRTSAKAFQRTQKMFRDVGPTAFHGGLESFNDHAVERSFSEHFPPPCY